MECKHSQMQQSTAGNKGHNSVKTKQETLFFSPMDKNDFNNASERATGSKSYVNLSPPEAHKNNNEGPYIIIFDNQ